MASDYDNENPYDNMSQHTTKESLDGDDVTSVKGEADTKSTMPDGTADAPSPAEANEWHWNVNIKTLFQPLSIY